MCVWCCHPIHHSKTALNLPDSHNHHIPYLHSFCHHALIPHHPLLGCEKRMTSTSRHINEQAHQQVCSPHSPITRDNSSTDTRVRAPGRGTHTHTHTHTHREPHGKTALLLPAYIYRYCFIMVHGMRPAMRMQQLIFPRRSSPPSPPPTPLRPSASTNRQPRTPLLCAQKCGFALPNNGTTTHTTKHTKIIPAQRRTQRGSIAGEADGHVYVHGTVRPKTRKKRGKNSTAAGRSDGMRRINHSSKAAHTHTSSACRGYRLTRMIELES